MDVDIEDEDSVSERFNRKVSGGEVDVVIIKLPHISNYTDYSVLSLEKSISLRYVSSARELGDPDLIILPGTKNTIEDLMYLKSIGMDECIIRHAKKGKAVIGICGGYQMLANTLSDPYHTESKLESISGLALLDMDVTFNKEKVTTQVTGIIEKVGGLLDGLSGSEVSGYEIHMGENTFGDDVIKATYITKRNDESVTVLDGVMNKDGNVFGTYIHGVFDNTGILRGIINNIKKSKGLSIDDGKTMSYKEYKELQYDRLADIVRSNIDMDMVYKILNREV
jgi:adenosylcobyric acid synthase